MKSKVYRLNKGLIVGLIVLFVWRAEPVAGQTPAYGWQDTALSIDERVEWLVERLTLDEKLSLMVHQNPAIERLGLPAYSWWNEALHGVGRAGTATVYPMPIALAATFEPQLVRDVFWHVAAEARRKHREAVDTGGRGDYTGLTFFTPNINIFRDPRWGRGMETYGEDPFLTAQMGLACVQGLQGGGTAACLKHLAVHSGPEGVRHEFDSRVGERDLRSTYLAAFEYIVKHSDVAQVMCAYNRLNGEPCCTNRRLFEILRDEWKYDGMLVTDCWALNDAYETDTVIPRHRTHGTAAAAYGDAFGGEVDLECGSGLPALREAVRQGLVPESKVDEHVRRLLRVRLDVTGGELRDKSYELRVKGYELGDKSYELRVKGYELGDKGPVDVAARSMVLLKNNGVLPLRVKSYELRVKSETDDASHRSPLILAGPNAYDSLMPLGNYNGTPEHCITIGEALEGERFKVKGETKEPATGSRQSSVVIYCGGLNPQLEGEELPVEKEGFFRGDRTLVELPKEQVEEIKAFKRQGYSVVLVVCAGSAVSLEEVIGDCDAVLYAWYGGEAMGTAVRQLLYGERDDFGRLPVTIYGSTDDLPPFEDYDMAGRTYRYADPERVEFPFGYGLSYSFYQLWGSPQFDTATMTVSGLVSQCNTDCQAATHRTVVQVYIRNEDEQDGPVKQLVGLQAVNTVDFDHKVPFSIAVDPFWIRRFDPATGLMEEPREGTRFTLQVGFSSDDRDLIDIPFIYHNRK